MRKKYIHNEEIEIKRNVIEAFLMKIKKTVKNNLKSVIQGFAAILFVVIIASIVGAVYQNNSENNLTKYYKLHDDYNAVKDKTDLKQSDKTRIGLIDLIDNSSAGIAQGLAAYTLGDVFYNVKDYKNSLNYYKKFISLSDSDVFLPLALNRAGISAEMMKEYDVAIVLLKRVEVEFSDSVVADQAIFNLARIYTLKGNKVQARKYFEKLIKNHAFSPFSYKAKILLALINLK